MLTIRRRLKVFSKTSTRNIIVVLSISRQARNSVFAVSELYMTAPECQEGTASGDKKVTGQYPDWLAQIIMNNHTHQNTFQRPAYSIAVPQDVIEKVHLKGRKDNEWTWIPKKRFTFCLVAISRGRAGLSPSSFSPRALKIISRQHSQRLHTLPTWNFFLSIEQAESGLVLLGSLSRLWTLSIHSYSMVLNGNLQSLSLTNTVQRTPPIRASEGE